jgi:transcriptional regulator
MNTKSNKKTLKKVSNILKETLQNIEKNNNTMKMVNDIDHNFFKIEDLDQQSFILKTILRNQNDAVLETLNIYIKSKI